MASEPQCMHSCNCDKFQFDPICDVDRGITYFSPCHANCKEHHIESGNVIYRQCGCNVTRFEDGNFKVLSMEFNNTQKGVCKPECKTKFIIYMFLMTVIYTLWASSFILSTLIALRSVKPRYKTFGQGIFFASITVIAFIPTPIFFGMVVDQSCNTWHQSSCEESNTFCVNYDYGKFRDSIHMFIGAAYIVGAGFAAYMTLNIKQIKDFYNDEQ